MKRSIKRFVYFFPIVSFVLFTLATYGQPGDNPDSKKELIKSHKIAFITDKLSLTPDEAQRFWPVFNEYEDKKEIIQKEMFQASDIDDLNIDMLTDEEATEIADDQIIKAQKMIDLRKEYHIQFKGVLPIKKVLKLYQSEREFQHELIRKIREEHAPGPPKR